MEKKSIIKSVSPRKERKSANWVMYYTNVVMDNGDMWSLGAKDTSKYGVWQEITYTIEEWTNGKKIKVVQPKIWFGGSKPAQRDHKKDAVSFAMSYTKDLVVSGKVEKKDMFICADSIYERMIQKY